MTPVSTRSRVHSGPASLARPEWRAVADWVSLTKPRITLMVLLTAACGMWLAPEPLPPITMLTALAAIGLVVSAANSMNCYLERDIDRLMARTRQRPLPAERLSARRALLFCLGLGVIAAVGLYVFVNPLTGVLGALSLAIYVGVYTPLKQRTPLALWIGAVPGAMPPLMGWTAATGTLDATGLVLFATLFLWQLPHFLAIATFRREEYEKAGHRVLPSTRGARTTYRHAVVWAWLLVPVSLLFEPLGVAGTGYSWVATPLGLAYALVTVWGLRPRVGKPDALQRGARTVFFVSILYLPMLLVALMVARP